MPQDGLATKNHNFKKYFIRQNAKRLPEGDRQTKREKQKERERNGV